MRLRWSRSLAACFILAVATVDAVSGDYLIRKQKPLDKQLADYDAAVQTTLLTGATRFPYVRMIVEPSFSPEWMVEVLEPVNGKADVRLTTATSQVWPLLRPRPAETKTARLEQRTAAMLRSVWVALVIPARGPRPDDGLDGEFYYFSTYTPDDLTVTAEVWSPPEKSKPGRLVAIGYLLQRFVSASGEERPALEAQILRLASALRDEINANH